MERKLYQDPAWHGGLHKFGKTITMVENPKTLKELMSGTVEVTPHDVERSFDRLKKCCETLFEIDTGNFPLSYYSSGEKRETKTYNRHTKETFVREELVGLPIYKDGNEKGLRFLLTIVAFNELNFLTEMRLGRDANEIIDLYRTVAKK